MTKEPASGTSRPKRTRHPVEQNEAPAPSSDVVSAVKRRRLNGAKPTPAPPVTASSSTSNGLKVSSRGSSKSKSIGKQKQGTDTIYDRLPGSSENEIGNNALPLQGTPAIKYSALGLKPPQSQPLPEPKNIYDVPEDEDDLNVRKSGDDYSKSQEPKPPKRRAGNGAPGTASRNGVSALANSPQSKRGTTATAFEHTNAEGDNDNRPRRRGRPPKNQGKTGLPTSVKEPIAARLANSVVDSPSRQDAGMLKGILSPQKKRAGRPQKSVAFHGDGDTRDTEVYFEDLPSKPKSSEVSKKSSRVQVGVEQASEEDGSGDEGSENDEVCAVCSKPDSEPPNEIIFCDSCDMAVHQKCYGMVETVISELAAEHKDEFHVVRLNGFTHTDDKIALKDIWRQLGREMDLEDELVNKTSNYADTMASLLALLSHPAEITGAEEGVTSKSVVFIIDEFDLFATHARQTLLYNLFDIAQARKAPIAVLGLTTRIDVVESLEKRVKSRFSHRYVYISLPKTLQAYWDVCRQGLSVDEEDLEVEGFDTRLKGLSEFHDYWEKKIEALRKTPEFEDHLEYLYYTSKSVPAFLTSCVLPLSTLSPSSLELKFVPSAGYAPLEPSDSRLHLLAALSDLELALLISAARLDIVAHTDTINFSMAYDEYTSQMGKQRVQSSSSGVLALGAAARSWGRGTAAVAWERLVSLGLLIPAGIGGRGNAAHGGLEGKMWKLDVALEEIPAAVELPGSLAKWCTQI
ncbi:hypothetical protein DL766_002524 [Monosporascus sp. MC13-8B]|uniref:Zinc finger PHD-type domain-containing protein n=1 Tax=Monosporascus cannonballus TaxID=155416 RepID=A0ABY0GS84_9PEZI|nr:hypothetical protein DL762_009975 [Monosporascus cannonballus]RYP01028.1 hypothetical protein DL763_000449 [Monosporascus cannonballus]RYP35348.1 hypothetical protein DL766_002524 [Monosporascus sp. MC13-8B]